MAIMPHPERDPKGNGDQIFQSIKKWIESKKSVDYKSLGDYECTDDIREKKPVDIEVFVKLIITDNAERTIEEALIRKDFRLHLDRYEYFGIALNEGADINESITKIMKTGELANFNKHLVYIKTKEGMFSYDLVNGLQSKDFNIDNFVIASDEKDYVGGSKKSSINLHAGDIIDKIYSGVLWNFSETGEETIERVIKSKILYNPHSMYLVRS